MRLLKRCKKSKKWENISSTISQAICVFTAIRKEILYPRNFKDSTYHELRSYKWSKNRKHGWGTHFNKLGADSSAKNTPNATKSICLICLPKPKSLEFQWKRLHWASIVRAHDHSMINRNKSLQKVIETISLQICSASLHQ